MKLNKYIKTVLFLGMCILFPLTETIAQNSKCEKKLKKLVLMDFEDIPTNIGPYEDCAEKMVQFLKEDSEIEATVVNNKKVVLSDSISDTTEKDDEPAIKKLSKKEVSKLKDLILESYDQFIAYYESSGVTDIQKVNEYKALKKKVEKI